MIEWANCGRGISWCCSPVIVQPAGVRLSGFEGPLSRRKISANSNGSRPGIQTSPSLSSTTCSWLIFDQNGDRSRARLVKMLTGLLEPTYWQVTYDHQNSTNLLRVDKSSATSPQVPDLYPFLTGEEYLGHDWNAATRFRSTEKPRIKNPSWSFSRFRPSSAPSTISLDTFSTVFDNRESNLSTALRLNSDLLHVECGGALFL